MPSVGTESRQNEQKTPSEKMPMVLSGMERNRTQFSQILPSGFVFLALCWHNDMEHVTPKLKLNSFQLTVLVVDVVMSTCFSLSLSSISVIM